MPRPTSRLLRRKPPQRGDTSAAALQSERVSISSRPALARRAGHGSDALRIVLRRPPCGGGEPISTGKIGMKNLLADWASRIWGRLIFQNEIDHAFHLVVVDPAQAVLRDPRLAEHAIGKDSNPDARKVLGRCAHGHFLDLLKVDLERILWPGHVKQNAFMQPLDECLAHPRIVAEEIRSH